MAMSTSAADVFLLPLSCLKVNQKNAQEQDDIGHAAVARIERLHESFRMHGMCRSVEGVLLVHTRNHPHILLLQVTGQNNYYKLPGGLLRPGEDEREGLKSRLNASLSRPSGVDEVGDTIYEGADDWDVGEPLGRWWRPDFEPILYPYRTPHVHHQKECKTLFLVHFSPQKTFWVPSNMSLVAVPLFEIYDNAQRFGSQIASLAYMLARFNFVLQQDIHPPAAAPAAAPAVAGLAAADIDRVGETPAAGASSHAEKQAEVRLINMQRGGEPTSQAQAAYDGERVVENVELGDLTINVDADYPELN